MTIRPSGTVTFLFTDIEGSTKQWEQNPTAMKAAHSRQEAILLQAIHNNGGYAYKMIGDAFQAAFSTAPQALQAALDAQRALHSEQWGEIGELRVRMALHTGITEEREGDYTGPALNRVARLLAAGHGGQTLLSAATQELVRDHLPAGSALQDMGEHRLRDLTRPEHIFQLAAVDLPSTLPPLKTLDNHPNNLPLQATPFIGREREVSTVVSWLSQPRVRLLTLTGPGGTGKTRLSLQIAAELIESFNEGVFFVSLTPIEDPNLVASTVAQALGVKESPGRPLLDNLKEYLADQSLLLVLDNFEQVVQAAPLVPQLLAAAPMVKVLVTSREALHVYGEKEYPVPPLALPDPKRLPPIDALSQYEAVALFIERARDSRPDFEITNENAPAVAEICVRLDGLPLAIELAAARARVLTPKAMLARLENRLKLLTGGPRDMPTRQQTLRGAIDWSYDLLDEEEKKLFRRLAVFVGGRTLEAVEEVCNAAGALEIDVLDGLASLVGKSLVRQEESLGEPRFWMLETLREYALEKLVESGEADSTRRAHAIFFLRMAEEVKPYFYGPDQANWLTRLELEHDNLRAVFTWSREPHGNPEVGLRLTQALARFWEVRGHSREGEQQLAAMLSAPGASVPTLARATALSSACDMAFHRGHYAEMKLLAMEELQIYTAFDYKIGIARGLVNLARVDTAEGNYASARARQEQALAIRREVGSNDLVARTLAELGEVARCQDDYVAARAIYEESLVLELETGSKGHIAWLFNNLGHVAHYERDYDQATRLFTEGLAYFREVGDKRGTAFCLFGLAGVAGSMGKLDRAARLFGAAQALSDAIGIVLEPADELEYRRNLAACKAKSDEKQWQAAWEQGHAMSMEQAVVYAAEDSLDE